MKKINNYSTQYKIISRSFAPANAQNFTRSSAEQLHNQNQIMEKIQQICIRKYYRKIGKNL